MPRYQNLINFRRNKISRVIFKSFKAVMPAMSATEKDAIEAGTVWWDAELFSGRPDWQRFKAIPKPQLTAEEQAFVEHFRHRT